MSTTESRVSHQRAIQQGAIEPAGDHVPGRFRGNVSEVKQLLTDRSRDRSTNLRRLQGWRGDQLDAALDVKGIAHRLAPILCAGLAFASAATGSMVLLLATLATALYGAVGRNHPLELVYNAVAGRLGRPTLPANRAAKSFGCAVGSLFLGSAALAYAVGSPTVGAVLLISLGGLATFVGVTDICVPSILYTVLFGSKRGTAPSLLPAGAQS